MKTRKLKVKNDKGQQTTVDIAANSKNVFIDFEDTTLNNEWQLPGKGAKTNLNDALKKTLHIKRTPNSNGTYVIGLDDAKANQPLVGGKANGTILDFNDGGNLTEIISYGVKADGYMSTENVDGTNGKSVPNLDYLNEHYLRADDFDDDSGLTLVAGNGIKLDQDTTKNEIVISATGNTSALNIGGMSTGGVKSDGTPSGLNSNNLFLGDGLSVSQLTQNGVIYPQLNVRLASSSQSGMITAADKVKLDGLTNLHRQNIILITDSYGDPSKSDITFSATMGSLQGRNIIDYYAEVYHINIIDRKSKEGTGFQDGSQNSMLQESINRLTSAQKNSITQVVVVGGYNDFNALASTETLGQIQDDQKKEHKYNATQIQENLPINISAFVSTVKNSLPNAEVLMYYVGNGFTPQDSELVHSRCGNKYQVKRVYETNGLYVVPNSQTSLTNRNLVKSDYVHPNEKGSISIWLDVMNSLSNGGAPIHRNFIVRGVDALYGDVTADKTSFKDAFFITDGTDAYFRQKMFSAVPNFSDQNMTVSKLLSEPLRYLKIDLTKDFMFSAANGQNEIWVPAGFTVNGQNVGGMVGISLFEYLDSSSNYTKSVVRMNFNAQCNQDAFSRINNNSAIITDLQFAGGEIHYNLFECMYPRTGCYHDFEKIN